MANGNHALKLLAPEPSSTPLQPPTAADKPGAAPAATAIETLLGVAMADAVESLGAALINVEAGDPLRAETRKFCGDRLASVVTIQLDTLGELPDLGTVALAEGRRVLLERHRARLHRQVGADVPEEVIAGCIDELCGWIITAANRVVAIEMAFRSN